MHSLSPATRIWITAEQGSERLVLLYLLAEKATHEHLHGRRNLCLAHFVMDISDKISRLTNHIKAAARVSVIIQASNLIEMPLKLALDHNVTMFFKANLDYSMAHVTAPFPQVIYSPCLPLSFSELTLSLWEDAKQ